MSKLRKGSLLFLGQIFYSICIYVGLGYKILLSQFIRGQGRPTVTKVHTHTDLYHLQVHAPSKMLHLD
jgi:hypothetical protein